MDIRSQKPNISCHFWSLPCLPGLPEEQPSLLTDPSSVGTFRVTSPLYGADPETRRMRPRPLLGLLRAAHSEDALSSLSPGECRTLLRWQKNKKKKNKKQQQKNPHTDSTSIPSRSVLSYSWTSTPNLRAKNLTKFLVLIWPNPNSRQPEQGCGSFLWLP